MMPSTNIQLLFGATINLISLLRIHSASVHQSNHNESLVLLHVLFRHGDRTPDLVEVYPRDPYANLTYYPIGHGELTNAGKRREYQIGKDLRARYDNFLGIYSPDVLIARTTNYNRTKASCELVLAGLYPPTAEQQWDAFLNWQPIPYYYEITENDHLLGDPRCNCPNYIRYYNDYLNSPNGKILYNKNKRFYEYITTNTGWNVTTPNSVYNLYFVLKSESELGFELPEWTRSVWPKNITEVAVEEYQVGSATTQMRRLSGGFLLRKLVKDTQRKIKGKLPKKRKVFLYSGHENNIAYLLLLLDAFQPHVPPFGAYLSFEVHKIKDVYCFRILYQNYSEENKIRVLKLPGCDVFCPLDKFIELVEEFFPTSDDTCGNEN